MAKRELTEDQIEFFRNANKAIDSALAIFFRERTIEEIMQARIILIPEENGQSISIRIELPGYGCNQSIL